MSSPHPVEDIFVRPDSPTDAVRDPSIATSRVTPVPFLSALRQAASSPREGMNDSLCQKTLIHQQPFMTTLIHKDCT